MQILTQRGGYITVHSVRSNEASFYIVDYGESNGESYDKNNWFLRDSLLEYTREKGVACRVDSVHFFVKTVIETYNSESDEIARLLLWMQ